MFGFKNKKNASDRVRFDKKHKSSNVDDTPKCNHIYQASTKYGVKPEYFDYNKIELNKFLTNDKEYRNKLKDDNKYCSKKYNKELQNVNCCFRNRYASDLNAFDDINVNINNSIEANSFSSLSSARNSFLNSVDTSLELKEKEKRIKQFYKKYPEHKYSDDLGLFPSDYEFIANDFKNQAYKINEKTKKMLLNQKTKVLSIDDINDSLINTNLIRNYDTKFVIDTKDRHEFNIQQFKKLSDKVTPELLMERNYMRTLGTAKMINDQIKSNVAINNYNLGEIDNSEKMINLQGRLKTDVPDVFEFMKEQEMKNIEKQIQNKQIDVIDLDSLTPYNVIKPDIRIRRSEKRNII